MQDNLHRAPGRRPRRLTYAAGLGTAVGMTALATAGLAGSAGAADQSRVVSQYVTANSTGTGTSTSTSTSTSTRTIMVDVPLPGPTASPAPTGQAPQMRLAVSYQRTGKLVTLSIDLDGYVVEPLDANNVPVSYPTPATAAIGVGEELAWGDGAVSNSPPRPVHCGMPQKVHQVKDSYTVSRTYAASGTYTITYSFLACGLTGGKITANMPLTF